MTSFPKLVLWCLLCEVAYASRFLYGALSWKTVPGDDLSVVFTFESAWNLAFYASFNFTAGNTVYPVVSIDFGDGTKGLLGCRVSAVSVADSFFVGEYSLKHTYQDASTVYQAKIFDCCR